LQQDTPKSRHVDFFAHWCTLTIGRGIPDLGEIAVKKIVLFAVLAVAPVVALAQQPQSAAPEPQAAPATGSNAASSHHSRHHHKRSRNSHHKHHRSTKQQSQPQ